MIQSELLDRAMAEESKALSCDAFSTAVLGILIFLVSTYCYRTWTLRDTVGSSGQATPQQLEDTKPGVVRFEVVQERMGSLFK